MNEEVVTRLDGETFEKLVGILTEHAQVKRAVRQHQEANEAEEIRQELYVQNATHI